MYFKQVKITLIGVLYVANALCDYHFNLSHGHVVSSLDEFRPTWHILHSGETNKVRRVPTVTRCIIFLKQDSAFRHECSGQH